MSETQSKPRGLATKPQHYFIVIDGPYLGVIAPVDTTGGFKIGRDFSSHFIVPHAAISRRHVRLFLRNGAVWIEDLNSKNGTILKGICLRASATLNPGDWVVLANTVTLLFVKEDAHGTLGRLYVAYAKPAIPSR